MLMTTNQIRNDKNFLNLIAFSFIIINSLITPKNSNSEVNPNIIFAYKVGENLWKLIKFKECLYSLTFDNKQSFQK